jgi:intracellular sulfur oxidation DsrE/DsrF family protein
MKRSERLSRFLLPAVFVTTAMLAAAMLATPTADAQQKTEPPIPGYAPAKNVPGAHETPDPSLTYKLLFTVTKASADDDVNPTLRDIAGLVNTMAEYGVVESHRRLVVVIYGDATPVILNDAAYKAQHNGHSNPNLALMRALAKAGVELHVCGQAVLYHKVDPKTIQPEVQLDLAAWTTLANYEARGYQVLAN